MKCTMNPRVKNRGKAEKLSMLYGLHFIHMGTILRTCCKLFPGKFYPKKVVEFVNEYRETCKEYDCGDDDELRDRKITDLVDDVPYISREVTREIVRAFAKHTNGKKREIYNEPYFFEMLCENVLLMCMQLHYSFGLGARRFAAISEALKTAETEGAFKWLEDVLGEPIINDPDEIYKMLDMLARYRKRSGQSIATVREQYDAHRHMEALRAYQSEVRAHDELAGEGTS